jgi:membrane-associated phospholipid phosphatase
MTAPRISRRARVRRWAACALAAVLLPGGVAAAEERRRENDDGDALRWDARWSRFTLPEYVATGTMLGGVAVGFLAVPQREDAWEGGILFDDALREGVVLGNRNDRDTAVLVGDVLYYGMSLYPLVVDVGVAALAAHQSPDVAWQMFTIDAEAFALTGLVSVFTQKLIGRDRPFADKCAEDPEYDPDCDDAGTRSQSLISGHTAMAFTGASLVCLHHAHLPLYGGGAPDWFACTLAQTGAVAVAVSRIVADRHYFSDAFAGASLGVFSGLVLPEILHYHFRAATFGLRGESASATILPLPTPAGGMVAITGTL